MAKRRAVFYIDGYNLYCGLKDHGLHGSIWLNLLALCDGLKKAKHEVVTGIKYFTALPSHNPPKSARHQAYLDALATLGTTVEVMFGNFKRKTIQCRATCKQPFQILEEKRTDVAIAIQLLNDYHLGIFDSAYIISADSDLIPVIEVTRSGFPKQKVGVWFPPGRNSSELRAESRFARTIPDNLVLASQFPDPVVDASGNSIHKPSTWV